MKPERATAPSDPAPQLTGLDGGRPDTDMSRPTRAQARALRHSADHTHASLTAHFKPLIASDALHANGDRDRDRADSLIEECIHTVYRPATGNWGNEAGSGQRVYGVYATKEESVRRGQELARATQTHHVVHDQDGTISSFDAYGEGTASPRR